MSQLNGSGTINRCPKTTSNPERQAIASDISAITRHNDIAQLVSSAAA
ncbi:hypothetical protein ACFQZ4_54530 [Catellatospora coxensis]